MSSKTKDNLKDDVYRLAAASKGTIRLVRPSEEPIYPYRMPDPPKRVLAGRNFSGKIDGSWKISSYSSLVSKRSEDLDSVDLPDRDADRSESALSSPVKQEFTIFSFPKGVRSGLFFHEIFQTLDFKARNEDRKTLIDSKLKAFGYEPGWTDVVNDMIENVLSIPLNDGQNNFTLGEVAEEDRINEMEFYFPVRSFSPDRLQNIYREYTCAHMPKFPVHLDRLVFSPAKGFMKGYIDLVFKRNNRFYIVDWKSNYLGPNTTDYDTHALTDAMKDEYYILQYQLYTLALNQYLALRVAGYHYEKHFGGVFYVFLRGVAPEIGPEYGIYQDLPDPAVVKALTDALIPDVSPMNEL
jgi:exodeoxyribonuclease V beta subunit